MLRVLHEIMDLLGEGKGAFRVLATGNGTRSVE